MCVETVVSPRVSRVSSVVRVWVDLTNSPHVLVLQPIVAALRAQGHDVQITARDFAQTIGLLERFEICLLYTSPSPRDRTRSRMPSSA